jgi:hypothetical protein
VRCGSKTLDQQILLKLNRNTWALGFGISNHSVSSNSNKESVQNCSRDLIVHRLFHEVSSIVIEAVKRKQAARLAVTRAQDGIF